MLNKILLFLLLIAIALMIYIAAFAIHTEGAKCTLEPFVYGAKKLSEASDRPVAGQVNIISQGYSPTLYFNEERKWQGEEYPVNFDLNNGG